MLQVANVDPRPSWFSIRVPRQIACFTTLGPPSADDGEAPVCPWHRIVEVTSIVSGIDQCLETGKPVSIKRRRRHEPNTFNLVGGVAVVLVRN